MARNKQVDDYIARAPAYAKPILKKLRAVIHGAGPAFDEAIKWGAPTFMNGGMVCSFHAFKNHVGFWFHKGVMLEDPKKLLQPGVTAHTMKNIRIASAGQIDERAYADLVRQAAKVNASGIKPKPVKKPVVVPPALKRALSRSPKARAFFDGLAPSHRREYAGYVAEAKRPETIERRVARTIAELEKGRKMHDKYRT